MAGKLTQKNGRRLAGGKPLADDDFALPGQRYPVDTVSRARNALARVAQHGTPQEKAKVRRAVQNRYQSVGVTLANGARACPRCGHVPESTALASQRPAVELARRVPVRSGSDIVIGGRSASGAVTIRHRAGGALIGELRHNDDGTWQSVLESGKALTPHVHQRAAVMEMLGAYNTGTATLDRPAMPLQQPPAQPSLLTQMGAVNVRAFASGDDDDDDDDDDNTPAGLTPRGLMIHKKLKKKGVAPNVALAMAKRAQNTQPGSFGQSSS